MGLLLVIVLLKNVTTIFLNELLKYFALVWRICSRYLFSDFRINLCLSIMLMVWSQLIISIYKMNWLFLRLCVSTFLRLWRCIHWNGVSFIFNQSGANIWDLLFPHFGLWIDLLILMRFNLLVYVCIINVHTLYINRGDYIIY